MGFKDTKLFRDLARKAYLGLDMDKTGRVDYKEVGGGGRVGRGVMAVGRGRRCGTAGGKAWHDPGRTASLGDGLRAGQGCVTIMRSPPPVCTPALPPLQVIIGLLKLYDKVRLRRERERAGALGCVGALSCGCG